MSVHHQPKGHQAVVPYLVVSDAGRLIDFLSATFGGTVIEKISRPGSDRVAHAEVRIGDSVIMMAQGSERFPPGEAFLYVYVPDTDAAYKLALQAGAVSMMEPANMPYGDRNAGVKDEFGNVWWIGTHVEDVSPEEIQRRMSAAPH